MDIISGKLLVNGFQELKIRPLASEVIRQLFQVYMDQQSTLLLWGHHT